jgi:hypothetical protein
MLHVLAYALSYISTDAKYQVGSLHTVLDATYGFQVWRYVKNGSASDLTAGLGVMAKDSTLLYTGELSGVATPRARMLGVAQHTITTQYYGWILCDGYGLIQSNGTQTVNTAQKTAAAGQFTDGVIGTDELPVFAIGDDGGVASTNVTGRVTCF